MKMFKLAAAILLGITALAGCRDSRDTTPPEADIVFPTRAGVTSADAITVRGTASDNIGVTRVVVNGELAESTDNYQTWSAVVTLQAGVNPITVDVTDSGGNVAQAAANVNITRRLEIVRPFGFEIDPASNTLYYVDIDQQKIMTVALGTGEVGEFADLSQFEPNGVRPLPPVELALDLANNRVFLTVRTDEAVGDSTVGIWKFDTVTEAWTAFSDSVIDTGAVLVNPADILLDAANNRLLVIDVDLDAMVAVDLTTGLQSTLVSNAVPDDSLPYLSEPLDAAFDTASNRILVVDRAADAVLAVDLTTGAKSLISGQGAGSGTELNQPLSMAIDAANSRALIFDRWSRSIMAVDLATGARSVFASNSEATDGMFLYDVRSLVVHDGELFAFGNVMDHVLAFDLATGARRVITNNGFPRGDSPLSLYSMQKIDGEFFGQSYTAIGKIVGDNSIQVLAGSVDETGTPLRVNNMVTNAAGTVSYIAEWVLVEGSYTQQLRTVNLADGSASLLSDSMTPDSGNMWNRVQDMLLDETNDRVLILGSDNVIAVDTATGTRSILSENVGLPFNSPRQFVLDGANGRLLVADAEYPHLIAIDLATGVRSAFSTLAVEGETTAQGASALTIADNGAVWLIDNAIRLIQVDSQSGVRSVFFDISTLPESYDDYWSEIFAADGLLYARAYSGILEIDPKTGEIVKIYATPPSSPGNSS